MNKVFWLFISALFSVPLLIGYANERRLSHWAWQPLQVTKDFKSRSLDSFIEEKLKKNGLKVSSEADRNLIADLPTTCTVSSSPDEVDAFCRRQTRCLENLVNRLLGHPRFGERMANIGLIWLIMQTLMDSKGTTPTQCMAVSGFDHQVL